MKKYQLLVDSPDIPMGTIAEYEKGFDAYKITLPCGAVKGHFKSTLVENRPTVWNLIEEQKPSFKNWRAEIGQPYFCINEKGDVTKKVEYKYLSDDYRYLTGNYFQTREEAEAYKARQKAIGRVTHAIIEANEGWEPDWEDITYTKYSIYYDHHNRQLDVWYAFQSRFSSMLPFCKTKDIALSIISSHKEDLDLIFNVKK